MGKCPDCGTWDSLTEQIERKEPAGKGRSGPVNGMNQPIPLHEVPTGGFERLPVLGEEFSRVLGGGMVPGSLVLIGGDPGIGKCVGGSTRVLDPESGAFLPITDWEKKSRSVLAFDNSTHRLLPQQVSAFHNQGIRPIVEVKTRLGHTLRCTANHPVLTPDGWRPVSDLLPSTRIATPRALPFFGNQDMAEHEVKLIGYILSDGSAQSSISVTSAIPEIAADLEHVAERFGMALLTTAENKFVPDCVFRLPKHQLEMFLKVLFSCDGSVYVTNNGTPGLSYSTISQRLAQDIQHLLLRFGFIVKLRTKRQHVNGSRYTAYELQMLGLAEVRRFLVEIGIWGRESAKSKIEQLSTVSRPSTHFDTIPTGVLFWEQLREVTGGISLRTVSAKAGVTIRNRRHERPLTRTVVTAIADSYPSPYFQKLAYSDIYWDEIESITPAGEEQVYDLTVPGAANFVANDLIIHNSTLLLQAAAQFADQVGPALYISAEESIQQIKLRATRMSLDPQHLLLYSETSLDSALEQIDRVRPRLVIVDSIQTVYLEDLTSAAGSVGQVREGALRLLRLAKDTGIPMFLVGHVTKEGAIAGPRVLEHIVDVVLYLEGERFHQYRLLRGAKNRFGSTDEVGVFEMTQDGLREVSNPSQVFLAERSAGTPGSAVAVTMEGTRPILVEVQALTANTASAQPRRTANGFDMNRLLMLIAVLSKRVGLPLFNQDIYVNIVGGLRITEPAADLAVAVAIASSYRNQRVRQDMVLVGEVGLSGELRSTSQLDRRLSEAAKLGFTRSLAPSTTAPPRVEGLSVAEVRSIAEAVDLALERGDQRPTTDDHSFATISGIPDDE